MKFIASSRPENTILIFIRQLINPSLHEADLKSCVFS
jgi:hypothetical protein